MNCIILVELMIFFPFLYFIQRSACHIQVFALSRWLAVRLPVNYYEFARGFAMEHSQLQSSMGNWANPASRGGLQSSYQLRFLQV